MAIKIPQIITDICNYLAKNQISLSRHFSDGRINATINEDEILNKLETDFDIVRPRARAWYDMAIDNGDNFYPINIKVTDTRHADNLNCKLGIYYALTGLQPTFPNEVDWLTFFEQLKENFGSDETKDYYFLIVNKNDSSDVFCNTLKGLRLLQPNGNNLPFQSRWEINRDICQHTFAEASNLILSTLGSSIKLRSEIYFNFKRLFPEYV